MSKNTPNYFFLLSLTVCIWAYLPGLSGIFFFDDLWNISRNLDLHIEKLTLESVWNAMMSGESGPLKRPLSMLSFGLNHWLAGMDPYWMKITNLIIHLANSILLCFILKEIFTILSTKFDNRYPVGLSFLVAGIWSIHPINVTAVSYIVQRMTSLASFFMLAAIWLYIILRKYNFDISKKYVLTFTIIILWLSGVFSKEIAALLGLYILLIEYRLFEFKTANTNSSIHLNLTLVLLLLPILLGFLYVLYDYKNYFIDAYISRDFNLYERLLTESRVVVEYIWLILAPNVTQMDLFRDDIIISTSLFSPPLTFLCIMLIGAFLWFAYRYWNRFPLMSIGVIWFFISHLMESTVFSLELSFLHRNYLASVGLLLVITEGILFIFSKNKKLGVLSFLLLFVMYSTTTRILAWNWSNEISHVLANAEQHPNSVRANIWAGQIYLYKSLELEPGINRDKLYNESQIYLNRAREIKPENITNYLSELVIYLPFNTQVPDKLINNVTNKIAHSKIESSALISLNLIRACLNRQECSVHEKDYKEFLIKLLENKSIHENLKSDALALYSAYMYEIDKDLYSAIEYQKQAISTKPQYLGLYRNLAVLYGESGDLEQLRLTLNELQARDKFGVHKGFIDLYELGLTKSGKIFEEIN